MAAAVNRPLWTFQNGDRPLTEAQERLWRRRHGSVTDPATASHSAARQHARLHYASRRLGRQDFRHSHDSLP